MLMSIQDQEDQTSGVTWLSGVLLQRRTDKFHKSIKYQSFFKKSVLDM